MTEIRAFPGVRFQLGDAELSRVLAPPYDVITPSGREALLARHPRNAVRLILAAEPDDAGYAAAGEAYRSWLADGVLAPDPEPSLYLLEQRFELEGSVRTRRGLLARFRAEDPEKRVVLPHEHTRKAPREDRIRLLRASRANFSAIFLMFRDAGGRFAARAGALAAGTPLARWMDEGGVEHRLWRTADPGAVDALAAILARTPAYIADGHHRYATALRHRDETGPDGAWTLGYFTPLEDPGLVVLPYHRILSKGPELSGARRTLEPYFDFREVEGAAAAAREAARSSRPWAFALAQPGAGALVAESRPELEEIIDPAAPPSLRALDPWVFHRVVLDLLGIGDDAVDYVHSLAEAVDALSEGRCRLAGLLRPTPVAQITAVADAGESMPAKSTFFHPKLPSGAVIHPLV